MQNTIGQCSCSCVISLSCSPSVTLTFLSPAFFLSFFVAGLIRRSLGDAGQASSLVKKSLAMRRTIFAGNVLHPSILQARQVRHTHQPHPLSFLHVCLPNVWRHSHLLFPLSTPMYPFLSLSLLLQLFLHAVTYTLCITLSLFFSLLVVPG